MMEFIGYIGGIAFMICALPQAYKSLRDGHSRGMSAAFLILWAFGEICTFIYTLPLRKLPLILNYGGNLFLLGIIIYFKFYEREEHRYPDE